MDRGFGHILLAQQTNKASSTSLGMYGGTSVPYSTRRATYPDLSVMTLDTLSIHIMSADPERLFLLLPSGVMGWASSQLKHYSASNHGLEVMSEAGLKISYVNVRL
jgi:hypothetical protein